jgi:putative oxidoreductase
LSHISLSTKTLLKIMNIVALIGRIMFALPMIVFGFGHFSDANTMSGLVPAYFPMPVMWVYATGAALILAAISILIQKMAQLSALLLGIMLLVFALTIWLPGMTSGDQAAMSSFMKDIAMAGGAFIISAHSRG